MARTPRLRHLRHGKHERVRRNDKVLDFLAAKATTFSGTGGTFNFTTDVQASTSTLTAAGNVSNLDTVTIGTVGSEVDYTFRDSLAAVKATATVTAAATPGDGDTCQIGNRTYRFKNTMAQVDDVQTEVAATDALDNLIAAVTAGAGAGTKYFTGTTVHTQVTAAAGAGDTVDFEALVAGTAANAYASVGTGQLSFGGATMSGGLAAAVYGVKIGASASDTLDNLIAAINAGAGSGTAYSTDITAHTEVTAAAGAGDTMDVTAITAGASGDDITTTKNAANLSWTDVTLTGGVTSNNLEKNTHGLNAGNGPYKITSSGNSPGGLVEDAENYFVKTRVDADNFTVCQGPKGDEITVTSDGTGTQTITKTEDDKAVFEALKKHKPAAVAAATDIDSLK